MTFDFFTKLLAVTLAPTAAIAIFILKDGHKRVRFAARAKIAAELVSAVPSTSRAYQDLTEHLEYELRRYLDATKPPTKYDTLMHLAMASMLVVMGCLFGLGVWVLQHPGRVSKVIENTLPIGVLSTEWQIRLGIFVAILYLGGAIYCLIVSIRMFAELEFHTNYLNRAKQINTSATPTAGQPSPDMLQ